MLKCVIFAFCFIKASDILAYLQSPPVLYALQQKQLPSSNADSQSHNSRGPHLVAVIAALARKYKISILEFHRITVVSVIVCDTVEGAKTRDLRSLVDSHPSLLNLVRVFVRVSTTA